MFTKIQEILISLGLSPTVAPVAAQSVLLLGVLLLAIVSNFVAKTYLLKAIHLLIEKTRNTWDDVFLGNKVFDHLSHLAPALIFYISAPIVFSQSEAGVIFLKRLALIYILLVACRVMNAFLNGVVEIYRQSEMSRQHPIQAYIQIVKILIYLTTGILLISIVLGKSPVALLTGLGAMTAVLMLVFKDTISGFVASIQLSANDMIHRGDWIEAPKYGADGDVIDVSVHTIKVQNWDKTITTIPTYALTTDAFKNWRGMAESGGRRIKRSLYLDMNSIKFCDDSLLKQLKKINLLKDYLNQKEQEIQHHNQQLTTHPDLPANIRQQTNIGVFRAYLQAYLKNHPQIHQGMTLLVRQLQPGPQGLPMEIYVFSSDQDWINYEAIQSDIFDHILAILPTFELKVFQYPSGTDFKSLVSTEPS